MTTKRELFVNSISMVEVDGRTNIPTALLYQGGACHIGYEAFEMTDSPELVNSNFKVELGRQEVSVVNRRQFLTASGESRSAHALTKEFTERALESVWKWIELRSLKRASRVLVAEPIAMGENDSVRASWLTNYRAHLRRILGPHFEEVDFLPEPFAVFQYYRYGLRHPLVAEQMRHVALVLDFGGGTFDVSLIETTALGDISAGGRNSRPLAASSIPVGGFFVNRVIAEALMFEALDRDVDKSAVRKALKAYEERKGEDFDQVGGLRNDYRNVIRHFQKTLHEVEKAKIAICKTLASWDLDANLSSAPAYQVKVPRNPLRDDPNWGTARLDALRLRDLFERNVWTPRLKPSIADGISRASGELEGKQISLVLLSGGSANMRWLIQLIKRDFGGPLQNSQILELQENFQEIVAKGLAVECARRTYNEGTGDFKAVTYNKLCLGLSPDDRDVEIRRFRASTEGLQRDSLEDGVLLPSASILSALIEKPIRWKVRLSHPPRRSLDYYFMRGSFDYEDINNVHNVDHTVYTPQRANFDASIQVELVVRDDGTTVPKFIYAQGTPDRAPVEVEGRPFYMDMTFGGESTVGEAYIGFDFGTSNSSFSFVERGQITIYSARSKDSSWRELSDLVNELPYPIASRLARYIAETDKERLLLRGLEAVESFLSLAAFICYCEYRCTLSKEKSRFFKNFSHSSAGPLWALLKSMLRELAGRAQFSAGYQRLLTEPVFSELDQAVSQMANVKHDRAVNVDYMRILGFLGNISSQVFGGVLFGSFEAVSRRPFRKDYGGFFRCARGPSGPFIDVLEYRGPEAFSEEQVFLVDRETKCGLPLSPLMLWLPQNGQQGAERELYTYDIKRDQSFVYKACRARQEISVGRDSDLGVLHEELLELCTSDVPLSQCKGIEFR